MQFKEINTILEKACCRPDGLLHEHEVYELLKLVGVDSPVWHFHAKNESVSGLRGKLQDDKSFVAKIVMQGATHKSDLGGIVFDVHPRDAEAVVLELLKRFAGEKLEGVLFVEQMHYDKAPGSEMLLGIYQDTFFGPCVGLGFGGTATEFYKKIMREHCSHIFIPAVFDLALFDKEISDLPLVRFLEGRVRGRNAAIKHDELARVIEVFQKLSCYYSNGNPDAPYVISELEINPAVVCNGRVIALDGVLHARKNDGRLQTQKPIEKIKNLLSPKTVAIAGASGKNSANPANIILKKLIKSGMPRESIYLIHPKEEEIEGIKCVADVKTMLAVRKGLPVDCLVVGVPAKIAGQIMEESFELYCAHTIQVISAGFGETKAGSAMQEDLQRRLAKLDDSPAKRPLVNGPNTLGNIYHSSNTLFTAKYKSSGTGRGQKNAALICQSGAFMITRISDLADIVAPEIAVSVGNQMDLSVTDFFEYLLNEDEIKIYGLYIEGLNPGDGLRLMQLIKKAKADGKTAVIYKAGRTKAGMEAAKGHTAAMAGDYEMFSGLMKMAGALVADSFDEFNGLMMLASFCGGFTLPKKKLGVAALSNAGFEKCAIADHLTVLENGKFDLVSYEPSTREKIEVIYKEHGIAGVVDVHDVLDLSPMMNDEGYEKIIRATLDDPNTDFGIYSIVPETVMLNMCEPEEHHREDLMREGGILSRLIKIRRDTKKPFIVTIESGIKYDRFVKELLTAGIPVFRSSDSAARAVAKFLGTRSRFVSP